MVSRIRAAWSTITASPRRTAAVAGIVVGALVVGIGFSIAVSGIRAGQQLGQAASATATATEQAPTASVAASPVATATATVTATPTAATTATAEATATAGPTLSPPTPSPSPTPPVTVGPMPTPRVDGECDTVTVDADGTVFVNGDVVVDTWSAEYGEQMPMAVLRLAARAAAASDSVACLQVVLPGPFITGVVEVCGDVVAQRMAPIETPAPPEPGPTMPPTYGEPTIGGVPITDRMLDVNSYPLLDIADVEDARACLHVQADANDVNITLSLAICASARLDPDGDLTIFVGDQEWTFTPEYVYDDSGALPIGSTAEVGLDIRNYKDDVIHLVEMGVWVSAGCP